jgi:hypothetical protein
MDMLVNKTALSRVPNPCALSHYVIHIIHIKQFLPWLFKLLFGVVEDVKLAFNILLVLTLVQCDVLAYNCVGKNNV